MAPPASDGTSTGDDDVAEVNLSLTTIPSGVQCVRVTGTVGSTNVAPPLLTVTAGTSSTSLSLGRLPAGAATLNGAAFNLACASVTSSTTADWISDTATAALSPGALTTIEMTFRRNNPVTVSANFLDNIGEIAVGTAAGYARMADGTVKQWGNVGGGLVITPTAVPSLTNAVQVAAGSFFACARLATNDVVCWGTNNAGVLGPSIPIGGASTTPVMISGASGATDIAAGDQHACVVTANLNVFCWGGNASGQLGDGTTTNRTAPVFAGQGARVFAGSAHTCSLQFDSKLNCWGSNSQGQLGDGTTTNRVLATPVSNLLATVDVALGGAHSCAVRGDQTVRCWGLNNQGQLGNGTLTSSLTPVQVSSLTDATQISAGANHVCVRRAAGALSCWGAGGSGQIGDGTGNNITTPVQVLTNVVAARAHLGDFSCAEMTDKTAKCWGFNFQGQLGTGNTKPSPKPTNVVLQ